MYGNSNETALAKNIFQSFDLKFAAGAQCTVETTTQSSPGARSSANPWGEPGDDPPPVGRAKTDLAEPTIWTRLSVPSKKAEKSASSSPDVKCCPIKMKAGGRLPMHLQNITEGKRELVGREAARERLKNAANGVPYFRSLMPYG
jgi:hypothetical protein